MKYVLSVASIALLGITPSCSDLSHKSSDNSSYPVKFSVGNVDPRFGVSPEKLRVLTDKAVSVWEEPVGLHLFEPDDPAPLKINLVFDDRQQKKFDEKHLRSKLDAGGKSYDVLMQEYDSEVLLEKKLESDYASEQSSLQQKLDAHNARVAYWNARGGAPSVEFSSLSIAEREIDNLRESLERHRQYLNKTNDNVKSLSDAINNLVTDYNLQVSNYNGRFVGSREFEKGAFNGREINIYEFDDDADLELTLIHELGHALGFDHVDDPQSIMYYKLEKQDRKNIHLSAQDLNLVKRKFSELTKRF